jgi:excisionase family DNA binding protein
MNEILTEAEVAELLDCEPSTVQTLAREAKIPAIKAGRSWRFPRQALLDALNDQARDRMTTREQAQPRVIKVKPVRPCLVGL